MTKTKKTIKRGGDCGCNKGITGGGALGPASFTNFDSNNAYSYPQNNYIGDPSDPSAQDATRMDPNPIAPWNPFFGGKKKGKTRKSKRKPKRKSTTKRKRSKKAKTRKYRGGNAYSDSQLAGIAYSSGSISGAFTGASLAMGDRMDQLNPPQNQLQQII